MDILAKKGKPENSDGQFHVEVDNLPPIASLEDAWVIASDLVMGKPESVLLWHTEPCCYKARLLEAALAAKDLGATDVKHLMLPTHLQWELSNSEGDIQKIPKFLGHQPMMTNNASIDLLRLSIRATKFLNLSMADYHIVLKAMQAMTGVAYLKFYYESHQTKLMNIVTPQDVKRGGYLFRALIDGTKPSLYDECPELQNVILPEATQNLISRSTAKTISVDDDDAPKQVSKYSPVNFTASDAVYLTLDRLNTSELANYIANSSQVFLDLETYAIGTENALDHFHNKIRLVQMGFPQQDGSLKIFVVDFGGSGGDLFSLMQSPEQQKSIIDMVIDAINDPNKFIIGHNITFDLMTLATKTDKRFVPTGIVDTCIGAKCAIGYYGKSEGGYSSQPLFSFGLKQSLEFFTGKIIDKNEQKSDWGAGWLSDAQKDYAINDIISTAELYNSICKFMADDTQPFYYQGNFNLWELENNFISPMIEMALTGLPFSTDEAQRQLQAVSEIEQRLMSEWRALCPELNPTQKGKLKDYVNERYKLNLTKFDKNALAVHADNPLIKISLKLSALQAYRNNIDNFIKSASSFSDSRVRTCFNSVTGTGRMSSNSIKGCDGYVNLTAIKSKPVAILNAENPPNPRKIITTSEDNVLLIVDLAASHARIASEFFHDLTAINLQNDDSIDSHSQIAVHCLRAQGLEIDWQTISKINGKWNYKEGETKLDLSTIPQETIKAAKAARNIAKNTFYGWLNGAGASRIQAEIKSQTNMEPPLELCQAAIEGCKALCPDFDKNRRQFMSNLRHFVFPHNGKMLAKVPIDSVGAQIIHQAFKRDVSGEYEPPYTQTLACIWSRIEASILKVSLVNIYAELTEKRKQNPDWDRVRLINFVYDEINAESPKHLAVEATKLICDNIEAEYKKVMLHVKSGLSETYTDYIGASWADK